MSVDRNGIQKATYIYNTTYKNIITSTTEYILFISKGHISLRHINLIQLKRKKERKQK